MPQQDCLHAQGKLHHGQRIYSPNRALELVLQEDGNLVLYRRKDLCPIWASNTSNSHGQEAVMQDDGNLVVYSHGNPVWASGTQGNHGAELKLQNDGNLVIYSRKGGAVWSSCTNGQCKEEEHDHLHPNEKLMPGQSIHSPNGQVELVMQKDGNLVLYGTKDDSALWASGTNGQQVREAVMQKDGNLVIYDNQGRAIWASQTNGQNAGAELKIQDDGNLCIYERGQCKWASGTHGSC